MRFSAYGSELSSGVTVTVATLAAWVTVTVAVPEPALYVDELAASGVYLPVSVAVPARSDPAGIAIVAVPALRVAEEDV